MNICKGCHTAEMLAWTSLHCAPFGCCQHSQNPWKFLSLFLKWKCGRLCHFKNLKHLNFSSCFRQFVVGHAFPYKTQLANAVKEGQSHNLTEQVQAEQQQHFAHLFTRTSNKAIPNTINCSGEKPLVPASNLKNYWQAELLASSTDVTTLTQKGGL